MVFVGISGNFIPPKLPTKISEISVVVVVVVVVVVCMGKKHPTCS